MVIDSSVVLAILLEEPEAEVFEDKITADKIKLMSVATFIEATIVSENRLKETAALSIWIEKAKVVLVPVDEKQGELACEAWRRFGKSRSPAALNFGDCFSYALAKAKGEKLLFKGSDFSQTDIEAA